MSKPIHPKARKNDLLTSKTGFETIVYDTEAAKASCVDKLTTAVWEACDGKNDIASILDTVKNAGYQDASEQIVLMALDQLDQAGLLEKPFEIDATKRKSLNRREMLRLLGARAAAILPVVSTIHIRPAIAQSSLLPPGALCNSTSQCASGYCCGRTGNATTGRCTGSCPKGHRIP